MSTVPTVMFEETSITVSEGETVPLRIVLSELPLVPVTVMLQTNDVGTENSI